MPFAVAVASQPLARQLLLRCLLARVTCWARHDRRTSRQQSICAPARAWRVDQWRRGLLPWCHKGNGILAIAGICSPWHCLLACCGPRRRSLCGYRRIDCGGVRHGWGKIDRAVQHNQRTYRHRPQLEPLPVALQDDRLSVSAHTHMLQKAPGLMILLELGWLHCPPKMPQHMLPALLVL